MYKAKHKPLKQHDYDLVVVGSGAGGGVAAHQAARAGKRVAIVEQNVFGGECPNFGCVPTKALLQAAETYHTVRTADEFGIHASDIRFDYEAIKAWKDQAVRNTGAEEGAQAYREDGIDVLRGHAHFLSPWVLAVGNRRISGKNFLIATGTHEVIPPIPGLNEAGFMTYKNAINMTSPPKRILIIGGGAIGVEFGHLFNSFGARVLLVELLPRLLAREDREQGELLQAIFESQGVDVQVDAKVVQVEKKGESKIVTYEKNGARHSVVVDEILLAAGKAANVDMGLENAGIAYDKHGIGVNKFMQTNVAHIYAAGDVTGMYMFTHTASYQSRLAGHNMFSRMKWPADYRAVPRCIFVDPECAAVGATEEELRAAGKKFQTAAVPTSIIGRANVTKEDTGFVKVIADPRGRLLGASIVAPRAGEIIHELTLAIQVGLKASAIDWTIHAFPTWSEAVRLACSKIKSK